MLRFVVVTSDIKFDDKACILFICQRTSGYHWNVFPKSPTEGTTAPPINFLTLKMSLRLLFNASMWDIVASYHTIGLHFQSILARSVVLLTSQNGHSSRDKFKEKVQKWIAGRPPNSDVAAILYDATATAIFLLRLTWTSNKLTRAVFSVSPGASKNNSAGTLEFILCMTISNTARCPDFKFGSIW